MSWSSAISIETPENVEVGLEWRDVRGHPKDARAPRPQTMLVITLTDSCEITSELSQVALSGEPLAKSSSLLRRLGRRSRGKLGGGRGAPV